MLNTYWKRKCVFYNDLPVYDYGWYIICEDYQAVDTDIVYAGYDEIKSHIQEIPCRVYEMSSKKRGSYLNLDTEDDYRTYHIFKESDAIIKVVTLYTKEVPSLKVLANMKADLVFQYMAQFINAGKDKANE